MPFAPVTGSMRPGCPSACCLATRPCSSPATMPRLPSFPALTRPGPSVWSPFREPSWECCSVAPHRCRPPPSSWWSWWPCCWCSPSRCSSPSSWWRAGGSAPVRLAARSCRHDLGQGKLRHPSLFARTLGIGLDEGGVRGQVGELNTPGLEADYCARPAAGLQLFGQVLDAVRGQPVGLDAVERRGIPALLHMPEDGRPGIEEVAALLLEHRGDEAGGIDRIGILATDHQAQAFP